MMKYMNSMAHITAKDVSDTSMTKGLYADTVSVKTLVMRECFEIYFKTL